MCRGGVLQPGDGGATVDMLWIVPNGRRIPAAHQGLSWPLQNPPESLGSNRPVRGAESGAGIGNEAAGLPVPQHGVVATGAQQFGV